MLTSGLYPAISFNAYFATNTSILDFWPRGTFKSMSKTPEDSRILDHYKRALSNKQLPYACPLCFLPFNRHDKLYDHIKNTDEEFHKGLSRNLHTKTCHVCKNEVDTLLRHMYQRHQAEYQQHTAKLLRLNDNALGKIPCSPKCFKHEFFFEYRDETDIIQPQRPANSNDDSNNPKQIPTQYQYFPPDMNPLTSVYQTAETDLSNRGLLKP